MGNILSQEELDALLASAREIDRDTRSRTGEGASDAVPYDFGRPDRTSKDHIRLVELLLERFAGNLATSLSAYLRAAFEASLVSVEQFTYAEALRSLPDPTAIYALSLAPFDGCGALEINPSVALTIIDRLLGGSGRYTPVTRALTEIEQNVMDAVARLALERLCESVRPVHDVQFKVQGRETRPQMLQVAPPAEAMLFATFSVRVAEASGMLHLCVPAALGSSLGKSGTGTPREPAVAETQRMLQNLSPVRVPVTAVLPTELSAREILALRPGDVLSLSRSTRDPIEVRAWHTPKFLAHPTRTAAGVGLLVQSCLSLAGDEARR
jgi:flagellar motor switch protein FliM